MHALGRTLGLAAGLFSLAALAAGADGSWTDCALPSRLTPDPAGRTFHVATWGTNPGTCPGAGYTFRTIDAAAKCAKGKDTIYVHAGTYGPVVISNLWPSDRVLITNAPGESPVIDGWNGVADYASVLGLWQVSNFAIQGLTVRNTGVPDAEHGGYGIRVSRSTYVKLYFNTVHDTARHGIITDGHQMEVVGNEVYNTVMRNRWWNSNFWDAAVASDPHRNQWGYKLVANSIHDSWGECADVLAVDGATVEGNRIYNCVSVNLFISGSRNVTVNRNWIYEANDQYNRPDYDYRATGILLANEGNSVGWSVSNVRITNNIVEWVGQGLRYWRARTGGTVADTYGNVYVGFNNFNRTEFAPVRFDTPEGGWPTANNRLRQNLVLNQSGYSWFSTENWGAWNVGGNWNYGTGTTASSPGIVDTWGSYVPAYDLKSGSVIRWTVAPWSEPEMPSADYHCQSRTQSDWNTPGAVN
ncbi:MAG TPA: right-handed parallel beta-helix repeat-containing protein [Myxococcaceae bacterium]|nr:right-handed parallel beta-helix repeat-containing protein [Myxococcaceae bacterium]